VILYLFSIKIIKVIYSKKAANIVIKIPFVNKLIKYTRKLIFNILYNIT